MIFKHKSRAVKIQEWSDKMQKRFEKFSQWHTKFTLFPCRISETETAWLERVERRLKPGSYDDYFDFVVDEIRFPLKWEYRKIAKNEL